GFARRCSTAGTRLVGRQATHWYSGLAPRSLICIPSRQRLRGHGLIAGTDLGEKCQMASTTPIDSDPNGAMTPDAPVHWNPPSGAGHPERRRLLLVGCLIGAVVAFALPLLAT